MGVNSKDPRVLRGGAFHIGPLNARSVMRFNYQPNSRFVNAGCRPARTVIP
jgi:formylglycine-generating enzyme required for sulfatase activity